VDDAICECLRVHGAGYLTFTRFSTLDTEVGGMRIPCATPVILSPQAASFDPEEYPDPLRFDIQRPQTNILTFGFGEHFCIGFRLARLTMRTGLLALMRRFPGLRLADPDFQLLYTGQVSELSPKTLPMSPH
jgi:cytochrome P450